MAKRVEDDNKTFKSRSDAYIHGIIRYEPGNYDIQCGWSIEKI